jgi:hypothetical protein
MRLTKLSLIATLAISSVFAGGDISPVQPTTTTPSTTNEACDSKTTINAKLTGYYYTDDSVDLFDNDSSEFGLAATLDVTHKFDEHIAMNFSAIGYVNTIKRNFMMEGDKNGAFINVANITANYYDTTFILGRQLLDTPMLGGFDWLLAPGAFEAYTIANNSIDNLTLVGSYVRTWRQNNTGDEWIDLTDIDDGNNWTLGAVYDDKTISANLWYYNVDAGAKATDIDKYTQIYLDAGYDFGSFAVAAQYVNTDFDTAKDSDLFALKATTSLGGFDFLVAYSNLSDNVAGFVGRDTIYTSSWNTFASNSQGDTFKFEASSEFAGVSATASYAYYEYEQGDDEGHEFDLILGYNITKCIDANIVYSNTNYGSDDDVNALEIYANYKF